MKNIRERCVPTASIRICYSWAPLLTDGGRMISGGGADEISACTHKYATDVFHGAWLTFNFILFLFSLLYYKNIKKNKERQCY